MREMWLDKQFNNQVWASEWKFAFVGRHADFIFRGCFDCHHLLSLVCRPYLFSTILSIALHVENVLFAILLTETLSSHRRVSSRFFPPLIHLGQRNFYTACAHSPRCKILNKRI